MVITGGKTRGLTLRPSLPLGWGWAEETRAVPLRVGETLSLGPAGRVGVI